MGWTDLKPLATDKIQSWLLSRGIPCDVAEGANTQIASAAQSKGWKWNPYGPGFTDNHGEIVRVTSEHDVFRLAGLPYREPWERL